MTTRFRFESRLRFFDRCIRDISEDFHKQYGPFYHDWEVTLEACTQYMTATSDYLRTRDLIAMECKLLLGAIAVAKTKYAATKAKKKFDELMQICERNDQLTLTEIDVDINTIKTVYKMIASAECEQED